MVALTVPTWVALTRANKKRPELCSPRRLGSPPPELPNHEMDISELVVSCKRHFSNRAFPICESVPEKVPARDGETRGAAEVPRMRWRRQSAEILRFAKDDKHMLMAACARFDRSRGECRL